MHELSVTQEILKIALRQAVQARARRVTGLNLVIGQLSNVSSESIQFCWEAVSQGTACDGARLHFESVPARLTCLECGWSDIFVDRWVDCQYCGAKRIQITGGDEFRLESIQIEEESQTNAN